MVSAYQGWLLDRDEVLELPVDELGLRILRDAHEKNEWHSGNWLKHAEHGYQGHGLALRALAEGWQWLYNTGLVAQDPLRSTPGAFFITRLGRRALEEGLGEVRAIQRLGVDLHATLESKVRPVYLLGHYETAAFTAMKEVEVRVRELGGLPQALIGVALMRKAFGDGGPLRSEELERGEQDARRDLFAGAIGVIKNPTSHRDVTYESPAEAAEVILLADLLMRILDGVEREQAVDEG